VFVDYYSHQTWVYFLTKKGETFEMFKCIKNLVEKEAQKAIGSLRANRRGEITLKQFNHFCINH